MAETNASLTQEQLTTLHDRLVSNFKFLPTLESINDDLGIMQSNNRRLLACDSAYQPIVQDLLVYLETAQEAIDDAMKDINDLAQEIK